MDNQAIPGERASVLSNMLTLPLASQMWINQIWQPRLASVILPFWNCISFPHTLPFPSISCPSKMSSTTNCHRQALTVEWEALYKRVIWKNNLLRLIILLFIFRKKRKFTRHKGLTQYIIIGDSSLYTLTHRPWLGQCWEEHGQHECIWDPSWASRNEPQCERRTRWQMMWARLFQK